jgi:hypothetical protein
MLNKPLNFFSSVILFFLGSFTSLSQTIEYLPHNAVCQVAPLNPKIKEFKTFDVRLIKHSSFTMDSDSKTVALMNKLLMSSLDPEADDKKFSMLLSNVSFSPLKQVESDGDLHVVVLLQKYAKSENGAFMGFYVTLYDKFMNIQGQYQYNWKNTALKATKQKPPYSTWELEIKSNLEGALEDFLKNIYTWSIDGYELSSNVILAQFEKVKKYPELESFNIVVKETSSVLKKEGAKAWLKQITKDDIDYWVEFVDEKEDTEKDDIKRAALHNLTTYYTLKNDEKLARLYLEKYQKVDVEIKDNNEKFKVSDLSESLINKIFPIPLTTLSSIYTTDEILEQHSYITVQGKAEPVEGDKILKDIFEGTIKIVRPEPELPISTTNESSRAIGGTDKGVTIKLYDKKGNISKVRSMNIQKITSNDGSKEFVIRKFRVLTFANYTLLGRTYYSPKISLYQEVFENDKPQTNSNPNRQDLSPESYFWVVKNKDIEGVQTSVINLKKRVLEYLEDCTSLRAKYQDVSFREFNILQVVKDYDKCK